MVINGTEMKKTVVHGVGYRLVFVQYFMTLNVVAFTLKWFIASLVFTSLSLLLLVWIHLSLYMYPPNRSRPHDFILIHAPIRLLIVVTFLQHLPQILFIVLGWTPHMPEDVQKHAWHAVTFIVSFNALGLVEVALREDLVWTLAGMWIMIGQLIERPKAAPVFAADLVFTIVYPVLYISLFVWRRIHDEPASETREGQIALPIDEEEEAEIARARARAIERNGRIRH